MIEIKRVTHPGIHIAAAKNLIELAGAALDGLLKLVDPQYAQ